jgi:hypothetical protein
MTHNLETSAACEQKFEARHDEFAARAAAVRALKRTLGRNVKTCELNLIFGPAPRPGRPVNFAGRANRRKGSAHA